MDVVHVLNVVDECMRWDRKQGDDQQAVAQAWKQYERETADRSAYKHVCLD
jgi:hypothetical protein